jgi:hypothetical protein
MSTVTVPDIYEAQTTSLFEIGGQQIVLRGRYDATESVDLDGESTLINRGGRAGGALGTLVRKGHPLLKAHPELFRPLTLEIDYG